MKIADIATVVLTLLTIIVVIIVKAFTGADPSNFTLMCIFLGAVRTESVIKD